MIFKPMTSIVEGPCLHSRWEPEKNNITFYKIIIIE